MTKLKLFQILDELMPRKKRLQYSSWDKNDKLINIKEKGEVQTRLI